MYKIIPVENGLDNVPVITSYSIHYTKLYDSHLILPTFAPKTMPPLDNDDIFEVIGKQSILLNHPYDSFDPVVKFITQASKDPRNNFV